MLLHCSTKWVLCHWFLWGCISTIVPHDTCKHCKNLHKMLGTLYSIFYIFFFFFGFDSGSIVPYPDTTGIFLSNPFHNCDDYKVQSHTTWTKPQCCELTPLFDSSKNIAFCLAFWICLCFCGFHQGPWRNIPVAMYYQ